MKGNLASVVFFMFTAVANVGFAQPITHQDDLNLDGVPDRLELEMVELSDGRWARNLIVIDGATDEREYVIASPIGADDGFGADARIGPDWTGDGIAEVYVSVPMVERWGGYGVVQIHDGVTFERVHQVEGCFSDIFGLQLSETPDADGDGWDELCISSHFIDNDLNVWVEMLLHHKGARGIDPIASDEPELVLQGADLDCNGVVDLLDLAELYQLIGSIDPVADLDTDGVVTADDVMVATTAWQNGAPVGPNGRLLFWVPGVDAGVTATGEAVLYRTTDDGFGSGGSGGGGGQSGDGSDGGGGNGGGGGGDGGGGDDDGDDDGSDDGDDDDDDADETKPICLFDNPQNWSDLRSSPEHCALILMGQSLGKYSAIFPGGGPTRLVFAALSTEEGSSIQWTVSGGTIDDISYSIWGISQCTVLVDSPGTLIVGASVYSPCGGLSVQGKTRLVELDLDIDGDNDDSLDEPERDNDEEQAEFSHWPTDESPGKVALTNIFDYDNDGLPGFIDGINVIDVDGIYEDDEGGDEMLVPMVFDVDGPVCNTALVRFSYPVARPPIGLDDELAGFERMYEPDEQVRLWLSRGPSRDPRSILDGGDFIPAEKWIPLSAFGLVEPQSGTMAMPTEKVTLWIEPIMPSPRVGDVVISAKLSTGVQGSTSPRDAIRMTVTEVELLGTSADGEQYGVQGLVRSALTSDGVIDFETQVHEPWMVHQFELTDPRSAGQLLALSVGTVDLGLYSVGSAKYLSHPFVITAGDSIGEAPAGVDVIRTDEVLAECDISQQLAWGLPIVGVANIGTSPPPKEALIQIQRNADGVTVEMKLSNWRPTNYANGASEFGTVVHNRITQRFSGHASVKCGMIVDKSTGVVRVLEGVDSGVAGKVQLDCVVCEPGYTPQVGQPLDTTRCWYVDIKTSVSGNRLAGTQRTRVLELFSEDRVQLLRPKWKWDQAVNKFIVNPKWHVASKVLPLVGMASAVAIAIHPDTADAMVDDCVRIYNTIQAAGGDQALLTMAYQDLYEVIVTWMDTFTGGDIGKALLYKDMIEAFSGAD